MAWRTFKWKKERIQRGKYDINLWFCLSNLWCNLRAHLIFRQLIPSCLWVNVCAGHCTAHSSWRTLSESQSRQLSQLTAPTLWPTHRAYGTVVTLEGCWWLQDTRRINLVSRLQHSSKSLSPFLSLLASLCITNICVGQLPQDTKGSITAVLSRWKMFVFNLPRSK